MAGPPPKDPRLRQRRNKVATAAKLTLTGHQQAPAVAHRELPARSPGEAPWHPATQEFWGEVWASPMAHEYLPADVPGLIILAKLVDRFHYGDTSLAAEIRLQRQCFGLTPLDRRRLQWEIERVEDAQRRRPTASGQAAAQPSAVRDPRRTLRAVK